MVGRALLLILIIIFWSWSTKTFPLLLFSTLSSPDADTEKSMMNIQFQTGFSGYSMHYCFTHVTSRALPDIRVQ